MKKTFIMAVAFLAAVACGPKMTTAEKINAFEESYQAIVDDYRSAMEAVDENDQAALESIYSQTQDKIQKLCLTTIKKNPADSVALIALQEIQYDLEASQLESVISSLSSEFQESKFIMSIKNSIQAKKNTQEGMKFIDFTVLEEDDNADSAVKFSDFVGQGKVVLVDFWASWCGPCKRELPNIASVYEKYHSDKFDVLSVAVWDEVADTKAAAPELGIVWNQIINAQKIPTDIYGIDGIPHLIIFAPDGTILKRGDSIRGENLEPAVREALGL